MCVRNQEFSKKILANKSQEHASIIKAKYIQPYKHTQTNHTVPLETHKNTLVPPK